MRCGSESLCCRPDAAGLLHGRVFGTENVAGRAVADMRERVVRAEKRFSDALQRTAADALAGFP
ncbi:MAG: hypothetical protein ACRDUV_26815 [Pseudonocardiaceae bacterium]